VRFGGDTLQFGPSFNTTPHSWTRCLTPWAMAERPGLIPNFKPIPRNQRENST
jgi:hypothetical protein